MWFECIHNVYMPYFLEGDNYEGFLGVQMVENPYPMNNWCGLQCFGRVTPPLHPILVPPAKKDQLLKSYKQPSWPGTDQTVPICSEVNPNINLWQEVEWRGVAWGWLWVSSNQIGPIPTPCTTYINDEDIDISTSTPHPQKIKLISIWLWAKFDQFQCPTKSMSLSTTHKQTSRQLHLSEPGRAIALPCTMEPRNKVYPCYFEFEGTLSELVISPPRWSSFPNWGGLWIGWQNWGGLWVRRQNWGWLWVRRPNWTNFIALCPPQRPTNYIVPKQIALILECKLNWMGPLYTSNWIATLYFQV